MDPLLTKAQIDIQERAAMVPEELVALITNGTLDAVVFDISREYGLTPEQERLLENEISLVLLLYIPVEDFAANVEESLEVGYEAAQGITNTVYAEIFELVDDILQTISQGRKEVAAQKGLATLPKKMERREDLTKLAETLSTPKTPDATPSAQIVDADVVAPIRTMEQDMNRVHGYGAYVAQQEQESAPVTAAIPKKEAPVVTSTPTNFIPPKENT